MAFVERYVRADAAGGGDGTTDTNSGGTGAWTLAEAVAAVAAGQRVNVKAGTYALTTATLAFATAGTAIAPIWWRGFNAVIGDLDSDFVTAKPAITFTTGRITVGGAHQTFSNLNISGATTAAALFSPAGGLARFYRLRIECTGNNAVSRAVSTSTVNGYIWVDCWFKAPSTATSVFRSLVQESYAGCVFEGGGIGLDAQTNSFNRSVTDCVFLSNGSHGIQTTNSFVLEVDRCTFSKCGGDAIRFPAAMSGGKVTNCVFRSNVGTAINNALGTDTDIFHRSHNSYYNNGAIEAGFGDSPYFERLLETADPCVSDANPSLVASAVSRGTALPGLFENEAFTSYGDRGAVQAQSVRKIMVME